MVSHAVFIGPCAHKGGLSVRMPVVKGDGELVGSDLGDKKRESPSACGACAGAHDEMI